MKLSAVLDKLLKLEALRGADIEVDIYVCGPDTWVTAPITDILDSDKDNTVTIYSDQGREI